MTNLITKIGAAVATSLVLATSASAMIGPYEQAVNEGNSALFTTGAQVSEDAKAASYSPEGDWNNGEGHSVTQFTGHDTDGAVKDHYGAGSR